MRRRGVGTSSEYCRVLYEAETIAPPREAWAAAANEVDGTFGVHGIVTLIDRTSDGMSHHSKKTMMDTASEQAVPYEPLP